MDDNLIEIIVKEVLLKLSTYTGSNILSKTKMLYIGGLSEEDLSKFDAMYCVDELNGDRKLNDYEGIILPELSCIQICAIYNGIPIDEITKRSINTILNGKTVLVRDDVIELYSEAICKDSGLYTRVTNFLNELINDGVSIVSDTLIHEVNDASTNSSCNIKKLDDLEVIYDGKLLNEKVLKEFYDKGIKKVRIGKKSIITPLAKDMIRYSHMEIIKEV